LVIPNSTKESRQEKKGFLFFFLDPQVTPEDDGRYLFNLSLWRARKLLTKITAKGGTPLKAVGEQPLAGRVNGRWFGDARLR